MSRQKNAFSGGGSDEGIVQRSIDRSAGEGGGGWRETTCLDCPARRTPEIFELMRKAGALHEVPLGNAMLCLFRLADYRKAYETLLRPIPCQKRKARPRVRPSTVKSDWDKRWNRLKKTDAFTGDIM